MSVAGDIGRVVVVGAGQAGQQVAASLRQEGFAGSIVLVGDEPGLPYQRPPLSKGYLKDGMAERLQLAPAAFYEKNAIRLLSGTRVAAIDRAAREVVAGDGARIGYDHLVLATGARNLRPPILGADHGEVVELRSLSHADAIRARMDRTRHAIVIGGGFIGLEFAAVARQAGVEVTVVEALDRLMARVASPAISARFLEAHSGWGTRVLLDALAAGIEIGGPGTAGVTLATGERIEGDMVLLATGIVPNAELAAEAGLAIENGVRVDARLLTDDPAISAIGDCASFPGPLGGRVRLESVQAAVDHARHVARRIARGEMADYAAVPWFWSDQGDLKLQIAGLTGLANMRVNLPQEGPTETVLGFRKGTLVAVETVNGPGAHMAARRLLARSGGATEADLRAARWDLRALAKATGGS
jgi:3-phenylpropionate/trans-cinnamate dioxygenase ferredoxin reductase component